MALIAMLAFSAVATPLIIYDQVSGVSVSYNVVAAPQADSHASPFSAQPLVIGDLTTGVASAYYPVRVDNIDPVDSHVLNISITGVPAGDSVDICATNAGTPYVSGSIPAGSFATVYLRISPGSTLGPRSVVLQMSP